MSPRGIDLVLVSWVPWIVVVGVPLLLALAILHRPWRQTAIALTPWAALPALAMAIQGQPGNMVDLPGLMLGTRLGLDHTAQVFLGFTALLWLLAGVYARRYLDHDARAPHFFVFYLVTMTGNVGLILAQDMLSFFLFFAVMSFASYGLIVHNRDAEAVRAGRVYIILVMIGEVLLFAALVLAAHQTGSLRFDVVIPQMANTPLYDMFVALILVGFGIKVGALPLHVWLPLAHPAAPTPASAVLSGTMIKAGLLGWLRFLHVGSVAMPTWGVVCMAAGLAAAFFGVVMGIGQRHPKTVLAYSSISQMGIITVAMGVGLATPDVWPLVLAAMLAYTTHHALAKGALFLGVGVAADTPPGVWPRRLIAAGLILPALALAGAPLTSGALAKAALKNLTVFAPTPWPGALAACLPLATVGTTLLMGRFLVLVWPRSTATPAHLPVGLWGPWVVLLAGLPLMALLLPWNDVVLMLTKSLSPKVLKTTLWPVGVGVILIWSAREMGRYVGARKLPWVPAGDLLVPVVWLLGHLVRVYRACVVRLSLIGWSHLARPWHDLLETLRQDRSLMQLEGQMRRWVVAGTLFLIVTATLLVLLSDALSPHHPGK